MFSFWIEGSLEEEGEERVVVVVGGSFSGAAIVVVVVWGQLMYGKATGRVGEEKEERAGYSLRQMKI